MKNTGDRPQYFVEDDHDPIVPKAVFYQVPERVLTEDGRMDAFNNDLVIRYLDKVIVKDDGYEVAFKAGVAVEVEI